MATRQAGSGRQRQVAVEVEEDRPGQVAGVVGAAARARLAEHPARVDDPEARVVEPSRESLGRDEGRWGRHTPSMPVGPDRLPSPAQPCGRRGAWRAGQSLAFFPPPPPPPPNNI